MYRYEAYITTRAMARKIGAASGFGVQVFCFIRQFPDA